VSCGARGTELVRILEASSASLRSGGAPVELSEPERNDRSHPATAITRTLRAKTPKLLSNGFPDEKKCSPRPARKTQIKIVLNGTNGNGH
jgi:hypothetical protein